MGFLSNNGIKCVVVLGVREGEQTKVLATYNSTVYCLMIEYMNGSRELVECESKEMKKYLPYIYIA